MGDKLVAGGAGCPQCAVADSKFVMAFAGDRANPAFLTTRLVRDVGAASRTVASSSTSVIKNGVCQTPGTPSRWSAVGAFNGRMVLISSTSGGQTEAAELCAVFKALAIKDALRLDGGPSAALMVSGELLNPLEGWDRAKYGQSRRIPYPLRISH